MNKRRRWRHWLARQIDILLNRQPATPACLCLPALIKLHLPARGAADATRHGQQRRRTVCVCVCVGIAITLPRRAHTSLRPRTAGPLSAGDYRDGMFLDTAPKTQQKTATGDDNPPPGNGSNKSYRGIPCGAPLCLRITRLRPSMYRRARHLFPEFIDGTPRNKQCVRTRTRNDARVNCQLSTSRRVIPTLRAWRYGWIVGLRGLSSYVTFKIK